MSEVSDNLPRASRRSVPGRSRDRRFDRSHALLAAATLSAGATALAATAPAASAQVSGAWQAGDGTWSNNGNWTSPTFPTGGGTATFAQSFAGTRQITLNVPVSLGGLTFDSAGTYRVSASGSNAITLGAPVTDPTTGTVRSAATLSVGQGTHEVAAPLITGLRSDGSRDEVDIQKTGPGRLVLSGNNQFSTGATGAFTVAGGALAVRSNTALGLSGNLVSPIGGTLELGGPTGSGGGGVTVTDTFLALVAPDNNPSIVPTIRATAGTNRWQSSGDINGAWVLGSPSVVSADAGATLVLDAPIITIGLPATDRLTKTGAGTFTNARPFDLAGSLTVSAGQAGTSAGAGTSRLGSLSIGGTPTAPTGRYDVSTNATILTAADVTTVRQQIRASYAPGGGAAAWSGNGITTTSGTSNTFGLAYGNAGDFRATLPTNFRGQSVTASDTVVGYARFGDANYDGSVGFADFGRLRSNYLGSGKRWFQADFNYDGSVGFGDFGLLRANYLQSGPAFGSGSLVLAGSDSAGLRAAVASSFPVSDSADSADAGTGGGITLVVDEATGEAWLRSSGPADVLIGGYEVASPSGSLIASGWTSLADGGGAGWAELVGADLAVAEGDLDAIATLVGLQGLSLGTMFDPAGTRDLSLQYLDAAFAVRSAAVVYVPEPASGVILAGFGAIALRRRRR